MALACSLFLVWTKVEGFNKVLLLLLYVTSHVKMFLMVSVQMNG